jgi:hypothetical protein
LNEPEQPQITEEELLAELEKISVDDVILQTVVTLVNLSGRKLTGETKDLEQARKGIDAARALLAFCPEEGVVPIKEALSQLQVMFVRESQGTGEPPPEAQAPPPPPEPKPESKLWTPPGTTTS